MDKYFAIMSARRIKIDLCYIGEMPKDFSRSAFEKFQSKLWGIENSQTIPSPEKSDIDDWGYSDEKILSSIPQIRSDCEYMVCVANFPIQDRYFARRIAPNILLFSFTSIYHYIRSVNIPLQNALIRNIYAGRVLVEQFKGTVPDIQSEIEIAHHNSCGCLFDKCGQLNEIVNSCDNPKLCINCEKRLLDAKVSQEFIKILKQELLKIKKTKFQRLKDLAATHPITSFIIATFYSLFVGALASALVTIFMR